MMYWILDAGYWMLDADRSAAEIPHHRLTGDDREYWILDCDTGYGIRDTGYKIYELPELCNCTSITFVMKPLK